MAARTPIPPHLWLARTGALAAMLNAGPAAAMVAEADDVPPDPPQAAGPEVPEGSSPAPVQADLSHFFARNLPLGTIRELSLEGLRVLPKRLVVMDRAIGWTDARSDRLTFVNARGLSYVFLDDDPIDLGWLPDESAIWYTSEAGNRLNVLPLPKPGRRTGLFATHGRSYGLPAGVDGARPGSLVCAGDGVFWRLRQDGAVDHYRLRPGALVFKGQFCIEGMRLEGLAAGAGSQVLGLARDHLGLLAHTPPQARVYPAPGHRNVRLGRDHGIWYTVPGRHPIHRIDPGPTGGPEAPGEEVRGRCWSLEEGGIQVLDLAEGPDGNLWFTAAGHPAIGRIDVRTGDHQWFPLPLPDSAPARIVPGNDGRMYFTELGGKRLGAITAVDPPAPPAGPAATVAGIQVDSRRPNGNAEKASPRRWKRRRSSAAAGAGTATPTALAPPETALAPAPAAEPPPAAEAPPALEGPAAETPAVPSGPAPAAAPAGSPPPPGRDYLAALREAGAAHVHWEHISAEHAFGAPNCKGQFTRSRSGCPAVAELIHHCLTDPICDPIPVYDGKWLAMRRFDHIIGYYWDCRPPCRWRPTENLVVVLSPDQGTVVTAYPVKAF